MSALIDITMLGTAALFPLPDRALTAAFLRCAGVKILFDCGEGTQTAARAAGAAATSADIIALTHYHGDHIFGLPGLLQTMNSLNRTQPLIIVGPGDIARALSPVMALTGPVCFDVRLMTVPRDGLALGGMDRSYPNAFLRAFSTEHRVPSQGYVFELTRAGRFDPAAARALNVPVLLWKKLQAGETVESDGRAVSPDQVMGAPRRGLRFVFSGDTVACDRLTLAARGADLLICEATYGDNEQTDLAREHGHMTFAQAGRLASEAGVRRLWLTHFSQMVTDPAEFLENAREFFPDAECAADGKRITLEFEDE